MSAPSHSAAAEVPLFTECVLGYRAWTIDAQDRLWPISDHRTAWEPGVNTARCNCAVPGTLSFDWSVRDGRRVLEPHPSHAAPSQECTCGLYSWRCPRRDWSTVPSLRSAGRVCGAVASWGQIQVHGTGFRAEHACVVALAYPPGIDAPGMAKLERVAARYRVGLVPLGRLEEEASRHGTPLPDSLRPDDEPEPPRRTYRPLPATDRPAARADTRAVRYPELEPIPLRDKIGIVVMLISLMLSACGGLMEFGRGSVGLVGFALVGAGLLGGICACWWMDPQRAAGHAARHARHHARRARDRARRHPKPTMTDEEFEAIEDALEPLAEYGHGLEGVTDPFGTH